MKAPDAVGARKLGYRASGTMLEKGDRIEISYEIEPQVHDETRPVWTTMTPTDRFDVRKQFERLARAGLAELKKSGQDVFECEIE